ncbi:MAG: glycyl-radical enzyme activating protein [Candidatus Brocadiia bacterium]
MSPAADSPALRAARGTLFAIDQTATHDGPGLRMTVYFKGCPLRCRWCHSPESLAPRPEVVWYEAKCRRCGACAAACPEGLPPWFEQTESDRARCRQCGACVAACRAEALEVKGFERTAGAVAEEAARLEPFFRRTGGGITLTGGEPTMQPAFAHALAALCRQRGIHVAVETCGAAPWDVLERLAEDVSLWLYDLKDADPARHRRHCGAELGPVAENLRQLARRGADVVVRVPLIPGANDSPHDVAAIARLARRCGVARLTLLPFNPAAPGKYAWLRRTYPLPEAARQGEAQLERLAGVVRAAGLAVVPA